MDNNTITATIDTEPEHIYEPLDEYARRYKDAHHKNAEEFFDELVVKSQVDIEANKKTVTEIKKLEAKKAASNKQKTKYQTQKVFLILLIVLSIASLGVGLYLAISGGLLELYQILMMAGGVIFLILAIVLLIKVVNPHIKRLAEEIRVLETEINKQIRIAYAQMAPLNNLFYDGMAVELMRKTIPLIRIDPMFDSKRYDYLVGKFGLGNNNDINRSALFIKSGEINGNPFYVGRDLVHRLGTKVYTGSITITWTTQRRVNGQWVTQYHSQVLTASLEKPCPYYHEQPYVVYGNEAAPDLIFHRQDSDAEKMSEKQIERKVDRDIKKLNRKAEKSIAKGTNYTVMANSEFEVLFGARDRNHETQFRLLFTPLAQKQLLHLMKDKTIGYGDNFDFIKYKMINTVIPEHLLVANLNDVAGYFYGYDLEAMRIKFVAYNDRFLKDMYFALAPLLAIPLYQQQKPHEYIYKDLYDSYVCFYEHERVANSMNASAFIHPLSGTRNILKTSVVKSGDFCDTVTVTSYGYKTINRTDYIARLGGDGRTHMVPVHWVEYIPVTKESSMNVHVVPEEKEKTRADKVKEMVEQMRKGQGDEKSLFMMAGFIAYING